MFEKTNGKPIIAQFATPGGMGTRPGRVVLVKKSHAVGEYVVAWQGRNEATGAWDAGWHQGDYCRDITDAINAFHDRARGHGQKSVIGHIYAPSALYCCPPCGLSDTPVEVLLIQGTKCEVCESVASDDGEWRQRTPVDAMKEAINNKGAEHV
jgi:hypothetical protein